MNTEKMYTLNEVADELRVSYRAVYNYVNDNRIKATKLGVKYLVSETELNFIKHYGLRDKEI